MRGLRARDSGDVRRSNSNNLRGRQEIAATGRSAIAAGLALRSVRLAVVISPLHSLYSPTPGAGPPPRSAVTAVSTGALLR
jgi:hypothetical protein